MNGYTRRLSINGCANKSARWPRRWRSNSTAREKHACHKKFGRLGNQVFAGPPASSIYPDAEINYQSAGISASQDRYSIGTHNAHAALNGLESLVHKHKKFDNQETHNE